MLALFDSQSGYNYYAFIRNGGFSPRSMNHMNKGQRWEHVVMSYTTDSSKQVSGCTSGSAYMFVQGELEGVWCNNYGNLRADGWLGVGSYVSSISNSWPRD